MLLFSLCKDLSTFVDTKEVSQILFLCSTATELTERDRGRKGTGKCFDRTNTEVGRVNLNGEMGKDAEKGCGKAAEHSTLPPKNMEKISRSIHIKKHKQILCSFITKYSATINIAFLSLHLRMLTLLSPPLFTILYICKYKA